MQRRIPLGFAAILLALAGAAPACDGDSQTSPDQAPTVAAGEIVATPAGAGLVDVTAFSFTAQGFSASGGGALTYQWDFNDGSRTTGGATVSHTFAAPGTYDVSVTAVSSAGVTASARLNRLRVVSLSDFWTLRSEAGLVIMASTALTQGSAEVWGDQTYLNCRYSVTGTIAPPRAISVTWAHLPGDLRAPSDCQALPPYIPWTVTFTGTADDQFDVFTGTMTPGGAAVLRRCGGPGGC